MWNDTFPSLLIGLREGLEAGLVVSILVATLVRADQRSRLGAVWAGVGVAVTLSLSFAAVLAFTAGGLPAAGRDGFGGMLSLIAVAFVTAMVFWMRRSARGYSGDLKARVNAAAARGAGVLAVTAFLAVAREGLETALFLWTTATAAGQSRGPAVGAAVGIVLAVCACWALYRRALKINLTRFFLVTGIMLIVIAAGVLAYGLGDLQESGLIPGRTAYAFDLASADTGSWYAALVSGTLNLTPAMSWLQVAGYLCYLPTALIIFVLGAPAAEPSPRPAQPLARGLRRAAARASNEQVFAAQVAARGVARRGSGAARRVPRWAVGTSICAVPAAGALAAMALLGTASPPSSGAISLSEGSCGDDWVSPAGGARVFTVANHGRSTVEVYLINPGDNSVYGEVENLAPGTSQPMRASLASGAYAFRCAFTGGTSLTSKTYRVVGAGIGTTVGIVPVTDRDLRGPVSAYRAYVARRLPILLADSRRLQGDLAAGNAGRAKADWQAAHLDYEGLGAAYGTFGGYDGAIDGLAGGLPGGVADPSWTGFHRIEYGLWHGVPAAALRPLGDRLAGDVNSLVKDFPTRRTDPAELPLRAHEILENCLQFQLTGIADYGSGTAAATAAANLGGTRVVLGTLRALIRARDPAALARIDAWVSAVDSDLGAAREPDGSWVPPQRLPASRRQKIDGDLGELLEQLAAVPILLEERASA
jgi:high-affinity iron transporter